MKYQFMLHCRKTLKQCDKWKRPDTKGHILVCCHIYEISRIDKSIEMLSQWFGGEQAKWEVTAINYGISLWGNEDVIELMVSIVHLSEYTKNHCKVYLKQSILQYLNS